MCYIPWYIACYITCCVQAGLLDPPDAEAANMFTASERLIQEVGHAAASVRIGCGGLREAAEHVSRVVGASEVQYAGQDW